MRALICPCLLQCVSEAIRKRPKGLSREAYMSTLRSCGRIAIPTGLDMEYEAFTEFKTLRKTESLRPLFLHPVSEVVGNSLHTAVTIHVYTIYLVR